MPEGSARAETRFPAAAVLVAALGLASIAVPVAAGSAVVTLVGLVVGGALCAWAFARGRLPEDGTRIPLALLAAATGWMLLAAALAVSPRLSLVGWVGQHDGALLWVVALLVAVGCAALADAHQLRTLTVAVAVLGALMALGGGLDAVGALGRAGRFSTEPSGFLESSASLGQLLLLALACAVAWLLFSRSTGDRIASASCAALCAGGLIIAQSRAAWIASLAAALLAAGLHRAGARVRRATAIAIVALSLVSVALLPAALSGRLGSSLPDAADRLSNGRSDIWRTAIAVAGRAPLIGRGPDQFSSWLEWDVPADGGLRATGAYDPHDLVLYLLVSGGVPALLLGLAAFGSMLDGVLVPVAGGRGGPGPTIIAGGLIAWSLALRFAWVNPLAAVVAAALAGTALGVFGRPVGDAGRPAPRRTLLVAATCVTLACLAALVPLVPAVVTEVRWARSDWAGRSDADSLEAAYRIHPDPAYIVEAVKIRLAGNSDADLRSGRQDAEAVAEVSSRHVDAALATVGIWEAYASRSGSSVDSRVYAALDAGRQADPASGLWDYVAALWASQRGDEAKASAFAKDGLGFRQPAAAKSFLEEEVGAQP